MDARSPVYEMPKNTDSNVRKNDATQNIPIDKSIQSANKFECIDMKNATSGCEKENNNSLMHTAEVKRAVDSTENCKSKPFKENNLIATTNESNEQNVGENTKFPSTSTENTRLSATMKIDMRLQIDFDPDEIEFDCLPPDDFDTSFNIGETVGIYMGQIYSPFKFWFQTRDHGSQLDELMMSLG